MRIPDNTDGDDEDTRPRDKLEAMVFIFDFENVNPSLLRLLFNPL